jgi:hypothetical protein
MNQYPEYMEHSKNLIPKAQTIQSIGATIRKKKGWGAR